MEQDLKIRKDSTDQQPASQFRIQQNKSKLEKSKVSYSDLHHEITKAVAPKSLKNRLKQDVKANQGDELIKYMSSLPYYLEKGKHVQENVLSVGVLDWTRLEKWQYNQKHMPTRYTASSSNPSSSFSVDSSTANSRERVRRHSLQFHLRTSPPKEGSQTYKPLPNHPSEIILEHNGRKKSNVRSYQDNGSFPKSSAMEVLLQRPHVSTTLQEGEYKGRTDKLKQQEHYDVHKGSPEKDIPVVLLLPKDSQQNNHFTHCNLAAMSGVIPRDGSRRSFSEKSRKAYDAKFNSPIAKSCPLPREIDSSNVSLPNLSYPVQSASEVRSSRCRLDKKMPATRFPKSIPNEPSNDLDIKVSGVTTGNTRSTSPFRRLSNSIAKIGKGFSSKDVSARPDSSLKHVPCVSDSESSFPGSYQSISNNDKDETPVRGRSSPLRRLFDPLLKPKAANHGNNSREPSERNQIPTDRASASSNGELNTSAETLQHEKHRSETVQALLQVTVRNGLPLFTFAADKDKDIIAATMKKLSIPGKNDYSSIYSFFAIQEAKKKKNGRWMNQSRKTKNNDYTPNVIAQMKVSGSHFREFVLCAVDLRETNQNTSEFKPNDELAAIVVSIGKNVDDKGYDRSTYSGSELDVSVTAILPSGVHSLPTKGGPSSLIQRWISNGSCDCGGWDSGCNLRVFANRNDFITKSTSSKTHHDADHLDLFYEGAEEDDKPFLSLSVFKDGIFSVEFRSSLSLLQAFSICIAFLESRKPCELLVSNRGLFEEKACVEQNGGEIPARYASYPPHSPVGRV